MKKYYNIHNIVGIEVGGGYKWNKTLIVDIPMFRSNADEYKKIKSKLTISYKSELKLANAYEVVPDLFINRQTNQFYDKKYGAIISKTNDGYNITCNQECNEWMMILLEYLLLENHATLIHSAGVVKDGKAYIYPSWGGVGKTASIAKLIRNEDYKLLGDDLTILKNDGTVYAFPKKFVLYAYHKQLFSDVMQDKALISGKASGLASKAIPSVKKLLRHFPGLLAWARRHNPQSKRVSPYEIFGEDAIAVSGKLAAVTWLERTSVEAAEVVKTDYNTLAAKALSITIHELFEGRLEEFFIAMCAENFSYDTLFRDSVGFIGETIKNSKVAQLYIPIDQDISKVASDVVKYTKEL